MSKTAQQQTPITREEALQLLSAQLRKPGLDDAQFVRVMSLYAKIANWKKQEAEAQPEPTLDELVRQVEQKRKRTT